MCTAVLNYEDLSIAKAELIGPGSGGLFFQFFKKGLLSALICSLASSYRVLPSKANFRVGYPFDQEF